jgi:hypothetical protein
VKRLTSLFSGPESLEEPSTEFSTTAPFAEWLAANAARLADRQLPLPSLDELASAGMPDDLLRRLRELVAQGETEEAVVIALLDAFLRQEPSGAWPRDLTRNIRHRFYHQVSSTLAATVESAVKAWCATG